MYDALLLAEGYGVEEVSEKVQTRPKAETKVPVPVTPEGMEKDLGLSKQVWSTISAIASAVVAGFTNPYVQALLIILAFGFGAFVIYDRWHKKKETLRLKELLE